MSMSMSDKFVSFIFIVMTTFILMIISPVYWTISKYLSHQSAYLSR